MENRISKKLIILPSLIFLYGCHADLPHDPEGTLNQILESKMLIVGVCPNVPKEELELISKLATSLNAKLSIRMDHQENLYRNLENHKTHIVACSINPDTPWKTRVSLTMPYVNKPIDQVFAVQQGENRWSNYVNEFIHKEKQNIGN